MLRGNEASKVLTPFSKGKLMRKVRFSLILTVAICSAAAQQPAPAPAVIAPGDNLHAEAIPPIQERIAEDVGRYTESRAATLGAWHPVRREMLIGTRFADTQQIHRVAMPGGARQQLTFFPDRVAGASYPPKERGFFVLSKDVGGGEWFQNYRYDEASGEITLLTDGKSRNSLGVWSTAGDRMAYSSTRRTGKDSDIYVIDPADPKTNRLVLQVEGGGWAAADWSPDDKQLLIVQAISVNETYFHLFDLAAGKLRLITPKGEEKVAYGSAEFAPNGTLYATSDRGSEFKRLITLDPASGRETVVVGDINWDIETIEIASDGRTLAFSANEDGRDVVYLMDMKTRRYRPVKDLPIGVLGGMRFHENGADLGARISSARSPGDVYSVNVRTGKVDRWTFSETGGLNPQQFAEPELIKWKSFDGRVISGWLYRPPAKFTGKRPVIVDIHGGPEGQEQPGYLGRDNYWINELGIALIFPNVRGSTGYGKTFVKLDNGLLREDSYKDVNALFDWIASRPELDAQKIMVTGGSYGGFMTFAIATNYDQRICCSVSVVGISNLRTFLERTESYRRDLRRVEYGDERDPKMREFMERIAAVNNADKISKPMFVIQGKNDPRVPWTESQQIVDTLKQRSTPVWYLLASDEGHGFAKKKNADFQFYASVMFVRQFLLGEKPAD